MIVGKIYKYRKLIICVMFILGVAFYYIAHQTGVQPIDHSQSNIYSNIGSYIKDQGVIDKEMVIKALKTKAELVGLSGHITKSYTYHDSLFQGGGWLKDAIGQRVLEMDTNAFFKMGINLQDISQDDISVYGNTLFIKIPKQILISLDIPYDQIVFKAKTGILRGSMSEADKQMIYTEIRRLVTDNILNDDSIINKSSDGVKTALQALLEKIPNCGRIVFKGSA
jgi:hypothetical protein